MGTEKGVMRILAQHCGRLHSRMACQNAMDPYCGWNELKEQCTTAPNRNPLSKYWMQSVTQCPVLTDPGEWTFFRQEGWVSLCCEYAYSSAG